MYHINIYQRTFHFQHPAGTSRGIYTERKSWMLEMTDDNLPGQKGIGECAPLPELSCDDLPDYEKTLRAVCDRFEQEGYINYPMMESYRDCDDYFENEYASAIVSILKLSSYKNYVAKKKLCSKHIDKYTKEQFSLLILQNLYKLNLIFGQKWNKPNYKEYSSYSDSANILSEERKLATKDKILYVINTSLFMITDYFGNRNGFYEGLNLQK